MSDEFSYGLDATPVSQLVDWYVLDNFLKVINVYRLWNIIIVKGQLQPCRYNRQLVKQDIWFFWRKILSDEFTNLLNLYALIKTRQSNSLRNADWYPKSHSEIITDPMEIKVTPKPVDTDKLHVLCQIYPRFSHGDHYFIKILTYTLLSWLFHCLGPVN